MAKPKKRAPKQPRGRSYVKRTRMARRWTEQQDNYIQQNFRTMINREMAKHLHCTPSAVAHRLIRLKLTRK